MINLITGTLKMKLFCFCDLNECAPVPVNVTKYTAWSLPFIVRNFK